MTIYRLDVLLFLFATSLLLVHSKGNQSRVFIGTNDAKAESPVLWPPHAKSWLIGKDSDAGRDWGQEEKGTTEDERAGWHHQLDGLGWTPGVGDGQGGLTCCNSWGRKESDTTERLNCITKMRCLDLKWRLRVCLNNHLIRGSWVQLQDLIRHLSRSQKWRWDYSHASLSTGGREGAGSRNLTLTKSKDVQIPHIKWHCICI